MPTSTVPANATALPAAQKLSQIRTVYGAIDPFAEFAADDSGAMAHVIVDEKGGHTMPNLACFDEFRRLNFEVLENIQEHATGGLACATVARVFPWFAGRVPCHLHMKTTAAP